MLNIERERDNFLKMCENYTKKPDKVNKIKVAGNPITGLADEFAE